MGCGDNRQPSSPIVASVGSKGDSYEKALAESFSGLYKWELIYRRGLWAGLDDVEFATLEYVDRFNNRRLHGEIAPGPGATRLRQRSRRSTIAPTSPPRGWGLKPASVYETRGGSPRTPTTALGGGSNPRVRFGGLLILVSMFPSKLRGPPNLRASHQTRSRAIPETSPARGSTPDPKHREPAEAVEGLFSQAVGLEAHLPQGSACIAPVARLVDIVQHGGSPGSNRAKDTY